MLRVALAMCLLVAFSGTARAQGIDGSGTMQDMVKKCGGNISKSPNVTQKRVENAAGIAFCDGFFTGLLSANRLSDMIVASPLFCSPEGGISLEQARTIFLKYAQDNPRMGFENASSVASMALMQAFPCQR